MLLPTQQARKEWVQSLVEIGLNSSTSVFFTTAKVTWRDVGDLTEVGGTSVVSLWGGEELHSLKWMVGSEVTQFNTNCFTLAKAAECLAKTYSAELDCPPVVYVFSSDNLALQAICNPRSIKAHSSCIHFHKALTTFFLSHRDIRLVLAWSPKNDDLALDLTTRNCAAEACLEFPPQGMDSIQLAAYQKSRARTKAFSEWEHKYLQDHLADSACTGWLGAELAPPRFACTHTLVKPPSIHNHPLWREATKRMTDNGGKKLKWPPTAFQLAVDHPFTVSYAAHFWPSDPPHTHSCLQSPFVGPWPHHLPMSHLPPAKGGLGHTHCLPHMNTMAAIQLIFRASAYIPTIPWHHMTTSQLTHRLARGQAGTRNWLKVTE